MSSPIAARPTRPRQSILDLFDPLHDQNSSPDQYSSESDKENSASSPSYPGRLMDEDITMSTFFQRKQKKTTSAGYTSPVVLKKRLVEVGDTTVTESSLIINGLSDDEDECIGTTTNHAKPIPSLFDSTFTTSTIEDDMSSYPRTPLRSLYVDSTTPKASTGKRSRTTTANIRSPLSSVINATPSPPAGAPRVLVTHHQGDNGISLISSLSDMSLSEPSTKDSLLAGELSLTPRDRDASLRLPSPHAANRMSLDLHASFNFQMDCSNASFDLMNDQVSLAGLDEHPCDDSFEMVVDSRAQSKNIEQQAREMTPVASPVRERTPVASPIPTLAPVASPISAPAPQVLNTRKPRSSIARPGSSMGTASRPSMGMTRPSSLRAPTPVQFTAPPATTGLNIVKRTRGQPLRAVPEGGVPHPASRAAATESSVHPPSRMKVGGARVSSAPAPTSARAPLPTIAPLAVSSRNRGASGPGPVRKIGSVPSSSSSATTGMKPPAGRFGAGSLGAENAKPGSRIGMLPRRAT